MMEAGWVRKSRNGTTVVFVHGILSNIDDCWLSASNGAFWPRMVYEEESIKDVGVYLFEYRADVFAGTYSLDDAAAWMRDHFRVDKVSSERQLLFVCHSMGGIVVRRFLVQEQLKIIERAQRVGLFLVASPSLGAQYANFIKAIAPLYNIQLDALRFSQKNAWLNSLDTDFINLKESKRLHIFGKELVEDNFVKFKRLFRRAQVVPPWTGARYFGEPLKVAHSDHSTIAKPKRRKDIQHRLLLEFIQTAVVDIGPASSASDQNGGENAKLHDSTISVEWPLAAQSSPNTHSSTWKVLGLSLLGLLIAFLLGFGFLVWTSWPGEFTIQIHASGSAGYLWPTIETLEEELQGECKVLSDALTLWQRHCAKVDFIGAQFARS
jgi:hypothetical protein